jgi:Ser/Thr protein kinase RdoA (MazF antagonist)
MYRKNRGEKIFENLLKLWRAAHSPDNAAGLFDMPEPLAYVPELGMVLQNFVSGRRLSGLSASADLSAAVRRVARNLAALHGLPVAAGERKTMADHIEKYCHPQPQALMAACPELAEDVQEILEGLTRDQSLSQAPVSPVHGDLGPAQIFIAEDRAFFVDFDGFCFSHAALDLSNFLVALKFHFALQSEALTKAFLETYVENQSPERLAGLRLYHALAYLRRAMICFRWKNGPEWRQQVRQLLETGNAVLKKKYF